MQNLIINANIWHTTNTPLGWAVNTSSHDVSSPFGKRGRKLESEKKGESESLSVASDSLGQFSRPEYLSLLQGIFPTQGSNPGFPHCKRILYQLSHKGKPRILEWVALSLLQGIFLTQELNRGLLHCRQMLYQLSNELSSVIHQDGGAAFPEKRQGMRRWTCASERGVSSEFPQDLGI